MSPLPLPGPRGLPLLGSVFPFLRHGIFEAFTSLAQRYGPCHRLPLPLGHTAVCLAHPDGVERVLRSNRENYPKGSVYDGARLLLGNGLVTAEGEEWQRHRDLAQPAFKNAQLARYLQTMGECTEDMLARWRCLPKGEVFDLGAAMTRLTLAIVGRTLFGLDLSHLGSEARGAFRDGLRGIGSRGPGPLQVPLWLPTPVNRRFRRALGTLDRLVYEVIHRFRAGEAEHGDDTLLGALMAARDPRTGAGLSDCQLRDEVITFYLAGHETTANLLTWTFYALGSSLEAARRLEAELDTLGDGAPTLEDVKGLSYAPMVLSEVLRLYPPVWTIARDVAGPDIICGYAIPSKAFVLLSPFITQRLEAFWPDPLRFDPERFTPHNAMGRHPFAWFPFSAGPRVCIGKRFSLYEAQLVLAMVMRAFRVRLETTELGFKAEGTLHPDRPLMARLEPRG
jgi:cytochrome P450